MKKGRFNLIDENRTMRGTLKYKVYRHVNGEKQIVEDYEDHNLIVNRAREQMAHLIAEGNTANREISKIAFGTNGIEANLVDTTIAGAYIKTVDGYTFPTQTKVQFSWSLGVGEANGKAILEFGLICSDNSLFARRTRNTPINKESDLSIEGTWTVIF
jgi:hypothetical protein